MAEWYRLDVSEMEKLQDAINRSTQQAGPIIDAVLRNEGAQKIKKNIAMILPSSGRNWKGKGAPASAAMPAHFKQENGMLSVTIVARGKYHYLNILLNNGSFLSSKYLIELISPLTSTIF